jgi:hypothetical protein
MEVMAELFLPSHKLKMKAKETSGLQIMAHRSDHKGLFVTVVRVKLT